MKLFAAVLLAVSIVLLPPAAHASCGTGVDTVDNVFGVSAECENDGDSPEPIASGGGTSDINSPYTETRWVPICRNGVVLAACRECPPPRMLYALEGLQNGLWVIIRIQCRGENAEPAQPTVTPAMVLTAFQRIGIPTYSSISQPAAKTLVNFDTIFHATAQPFDASVTLLGQRVDLAIRPSRFTWEFGDGTTISTETGGAPYPSKEIVHRYAKAHTTVAHRVVITWSATYRVNGGPEQPVPGTVTRPGPTTSLRISEATPVLSGEGH